MGMCLQFATTADWEGYKKKKQATRLSPAYHQPKSKSRLFRIFLALKWSSTINILFAETAVNKGFTAYVLLYRDIDLYFHIKLFDNIFFISGRFW